MVWSTDEKIRTTLRGKTDSTVVQYCSVVFQQLNSSHSSALSSQVPGQRLVYRFSKLPYEYIPGVTRSSSLQGQRIPETVRSQEQGSRDSSDDGTLSAFSPTRIPLGKSWSWPVVPGPCQPIGCSRTNVTDQIPPLCYTGSKLILPIVRHSSPPPEWLVFRPVDSVSQFYKTCPFPRSIPVSVIKPTAEVSLQQWKRIWVAIPL